jgi:hypothetical protein
MKLDYHQATISFCMDLTSPDAPSQPIATLLVGEFGGRAVACLAAIIPRHLDPISVAVLDDTHQLIRKSVDEAFERCDRALLGSVLAHVSGSLRNTVHVSAIAKPAHVDIPSVDRLGPVVVQLVQQALAAARVGHELLEMPSTFFWARPNRAPVSCMMA